DTVTIGTFSGTVSKIRIRATTITDFDRKEVIIPNKVLMTERLINWSLSDTVTRVIVRVGVAYGSDLELTRTLLKQAADDNSRVLKDPAPIVYFLTFGPSTLDHELRFFVSELGDRNPAVDELNRKIDALFKANGIEIAFNQMDVYIKNMKGEEQKVESDSAQPPALPGAQPV
ncbi:TPA: mechanosensitive ion channel domain-containing protein, partial [Aeromonas hydrophila]